MSAFASGDGRGEAAMRRRGALAFAAAAAVVGICLGASTRAEPRSGVARIGVLLLFATPAPQDDPFERGFAHGLAQLGYVEGKNIVVERRSASGQPDRLAAMAAELVALHVDVIIAGGQPAREAARKATSTVPILTISGSDPVREGWAQSLARPGGNVTGLTFSFPELGPKRLELLKEALPALSRVAVLIDPIELVDVADVIRETKAGGERLGLQVQIVHVAGPQGFEAAFAAARSERAQAVFAIATWSHSTRIAALAARDKLASIGELAADARDGFLLGYGVDIDDLVRRAVAKMDQILKGARAGELPIERPTKFRLGVNLRTARAIGVTIPNSLIARADEVFE
jgi:putative ABC transport system substrate-binding protein